jgi:hypothetical protein
MKCIEVLGNLRTYISNEENNILEMVQSGDVKYRNEFSERELELINGLVKRGILSRHNDDYGLFFNLIK